MRKYLLLLTACICLAGCSISTTAAMQGVSTMATSNLAYLDTIAELADHLADEQAKAALKAKVEEEIAKTVALYKALTANLKELGDIDFTQFIGPSLELWQKYGGDK